MPPDDIKTEIPPSSGETRGPAQRPTPAPTAEPHLKEVGPESEVRGGPEAPRE